MFETLKPIPPDAILGVIAEYQKDARKEKVDLGVGVYRNAAGETPVLSAVKKAEQIVLDTQKSKAYLGSAGDPVFNAAMQQITFGDSVPDERLATLQAPGGSGSLRVAAGVILRSAKEATVWASEPTWANHIPLLGGAGLKLESYAYYDPATHTVRNDDMLEAMRGIPRGGILLLHACCHNPSGMDPSKDTWREIADIVVERELVPFIDMAYQGFAENVEEDAFPIRLMAERVPEMIVTNSCSKNFGLYRDRVGTLSLLAADGKSRDTVLSQASNVVRTMYSVPPDHGAAVVSLILMDDGLRGEWLAELESMRRRLVGVRVLLHDALRSAAPRHDFSHLVRANGMFCFLGLTREQVGRLKREHGVYMVDSSRINVAGITKDNAAYVAKAIASVLGAD